ncbi:ABC transporter ATP-binding protein [Oceanirhabdus sp. W0125-5]|uniref:ABC transporter ATP-binding protein n=1 Tax=Oceanirhabdus sp. W0125-5 TaxID=2999116 RepID=UPI0022F335B7|nr:oligopeptide/dipeptide ABC transporter ATP-binding protein [Oceanirhabdus sp. W0125-5]WBW96348.1 ATP-binding cassette domain-containing protein [Oceanirhabdus sp. W0125-5]
MKDKDYLLEVKNLKKYFPIKKGVFFRTGGYIKSVDDVSFKLTRGKIMGLVGESGCGKSTTGRTILNLLEPNGGTVKFEDKIIFDVENKIKISRDQMLSLRRDMQIIFQDPYASLDPRMNVGAILTEGLKNHNIVQGKEALDKAKEILELCGLDSSYINRYPHEFSGGQRQRIGIGRALSLNPKFIVCDEPTAALDVSIQSQILNLMLDLKDKFNLTYLFISHNLNVVRFFCDEIHVMYLGVIVEKGDSEEIYTNPQHPYTKALLSSIPVSHPSIKRERIRLKGIIPSPSNVPFGCRFHTRCPYAKEVCTEQIPGYREVDKGHFVACHLV